MASSTDATTSSCRSDGSSSRLHMLHATAELKPGLRRRQPTLVVHTPSTAGATTTLVQGIIVSIVIAIDVVPHSPHRRLDNSHRVWQDAYYFSCHALGSIAEKIGRVTHRT